MRSASTRMASSVLGGRRFPDLSGLRRNRFLLLLLALISLLLLSPVLEGHARGTLLLTMLFTLVLLAAVFASSAQSWSLTVALVFALPWVYLTWLHPLWRADATDVVANLLLVCLGLFVIAVVLARVVRTAEVGVDTVCGAIAAYLLIGVVWAVCYGVIEALVPGSFGLEQRESAIVWNELLYFSLVTLTTLGYGDITPMGPIARVWSALEAITGTLYLAVLIARLVGIYRDAAEA